MSTNTAKSLARTLIADDMSRADETPVERDGAKAVAGWLQSAHDAGDSDTYEAIEACGADAVARAWDALIDEMYPEEDEEEDEGVDADDCCLACGHPADGSSGHGACHAPCHTQDRSEWTRPDAEPATKEDVTRWESVAAYVSTFPSDDGEGACDGEVRVGEAGVRWYVQTSDEAGGSDEADDTAYDTRKEAVAAAEELADRLGEGEPGEDAEDYLARKLRERAGEPCTDGEWCVYWSTSLEDSGPRERYDSEDAARAAVEIANADLHAAHPGGNLLCGFEVRELVDGEWVRSDDE